MMELLVDAIRYPFFFIVFITIIVFIHEFGHYLAARVSGVRVDEFSVGFGKELFGFYDKVGTRWKISLIPFGGYVKMYGDVDASSATDVALTRKMSKAQKRVSFYFQNRLVKSFIVLAGPLANYLLAFVIMAMMYINFGKAYTLPEITTIKEDSPAQIGGLEVGDTLLAIDGNELDSFEDVRKAIAMSVGEPLDIKVSRRGRDLAFSITPQLIRVKEALRGEITIAFLGIGSDKIQHQAMGVGEALKQAGVDCYEISAMTLKGISQLIMGQRDLRENLGGPVQIAEFSAKSAEVGFWSFITLVSFFSLSIGLINLLPIPMLDGGHLFIYLIESVLRRPINAKLLNVLFKVGFFFIISLMIFATVNDIAKLIG